VKNKNSEPNLVLLPQNKTAIVRTKETKPNNGSDLLARLFAYKKITQEYYPIFAKTTSDSTLTDQLVTEGQIANVVSPITSLIVLETQKDYERFDIKNKTKTLDNSSIFKNKEAGAAPEPHEWALIIICGLMLVLFYKDSILRKMFGYAK
jgi:XrtN system VIT domain protein